jgi:hypothetical protein
MGEHPNSGSRRFWRRSILDELQTLQSEAAVTSQRLRWATTAAVVCALAALSASVGTVVAIVVG